MADTAFETQYAKRPAYPRPMPAMKPNRPMGPPRQTADGMAQAMRKKSGVDPMLIAQMLRTAAGAKGVR